MAYGRYVTIGVLSDLHERHREEQTSALLYKIATAFLATVITTVTCFVVAATRVHADPDQYIDYQAVFEAEAALRCYQNSQVDLFEEEEIEWIDILPEPVYHSESNWYMYSGSYGKWSIAGRKAWAHAFRLYYQGLIHGSHADYQCTFFAQMWFYDIYGFNSCGNGPSGDGAHFASYVYAANTWTDEDGQVQHWFEYTDEPRTMGLISICSIANPNGHVICVDEVDYLNGTITISDGNASNEGDVRIRQTMTLEEFYRENPGRYIYVSPTPELILKLNDLSQEG